MTLSIGDEAPDFSLVDVSGEQHTLTQYRGKKVMLSFYHNAACPYCNYAVDELKGRYKKLAWAAKLHVIAVFQSPTEKVDNFILKTRDMTITDFPFVLLSDPQLTSFCDYQVKERRIGYFGGTSFLGLRHQEPKACQGYYDKYAAENCIANETFDNISNPSDFLIDENGTIVDLFRGRDLTEHISSERIESFLLFGKSQRQLRSSRRRSVFQRARSNLSMSGSSARGSTSTRGSMPFTSSTRFKSSKTLSSSTKGSMRFTSSILFRSSKTLSSAQKELEESNDSL